MQATPINFVEIVFKSIFPTTTIVAIIGDTGVIGGCRLGLELNWSLVRFFSLFELGSYGNPGRFCFGVGFRGIVAH